MYIMYADEADQDGSKEFIVYAAVFFPTENIGKIHTSISKLRAHYGFGHEDPLKFSTGTIPKSVTREAHAELKNTILELGANFGCKACCYVVPSAIAANQDLETRLTWAVNTLSLKFNQFLREADCDAGMIKFDRTTDYKQDNYLKAIFQQGLTLGNNTKRLDRVVAIDSTQAGLSHLASVTDIVVGSFRFAINEPDKDQVGSKLIKSLSKMMWGKPDGQGTLHVRERGIIIRPKEIALDSYKADIADFIDRMHRYQK